MISDVLYIPQIHEVEIVKHFGRNARYDGPQVFEHPLYLLAFANRSGSNLLAEYLRSTGVFTGFEESLNFDLVIESAVANSFTSFPEYIRAVEAEMAPRGKIRGYKANWMQILMLYRLGITKMYPSVRVIHIYRQNMLDQAISFSIAWQTKQWMSIDSKVAEPKFDYEDISARLHGSSLSMDAIRHICLIFDIPYVEVTYEDLTRSPRAAVEQVFRFAGETLGDWQPPVPKLQRQSDSTNEDFRQRFLAEARKRAMG